MKFDLLSVGIASLVCLLTAVINHLGIFDRFVLRWLVRLCIKVPKSSKFKELLNKPLKSMDQKFPADSKELSEILVKINKDPNLKYAGVNRDVSLIIKCLFDDREELLVDTMDNFDISKSGVEILIFKFEKSVGDETYDRSLFIDIAAYRGILFQFHSSLMIVFTVIAFLIGSSADSRSVISNLFKPFPNINLLSS